jgi:hypothetical protein
MHLGALPQEVVTPKPPGKKRLVVKGEFLGRIPAPPGKKKQKRELSEMASVDAGMVEVLANCGKWSKPHNKIRFAIWHCLRATPELQGIDDARLWDVLGRWGSETRAIKESPYINDRHMALGHLQRLLLGMRSAEADPQRAGMVAGEATRLFRSAVQAWEKALARHLDEHPDLLLTPDEFAGFMALENAPESLHRGMMSTPPPVRLRRTEKR